MNPVENVRPSSRLAPLTIGTRANAPASTACRVGTGSTEVPLVRNGLNDPLASSSAAAGRDRRQATAVAGSGQPAAAANAALADSVRASGRVAQEPRCSMACPNRPREPGATRWAQTDQPPADSPPTVTRPGSPPNAAALARTQR